jgi:MFS-type transporter involved in bile tolerance (Atg22 family)
MKNDRKEIFGWMMYDWANSAFFTTVVGVLIGPYLLALAQKAVGEDGIILDLFCLRSREGTAGILYGPFGRVDGCFFAGLRCNS